ncbi:MAG: hypothetical protein EZS28_039259 [Streblomastix strix]|uniref:Uncharacterized protein n=1 Tax=Streblomastix strix TaxID=222440 RepID=A0A5J4U675_9EUKA|nr:MAG: hypothetical protein EZS28_039259 [Streblomastix strix]
MLNKSLITKARTCAQTLVPLHPLNQVSKLNQIIQQSPNKTINQNRSVQNQQQIPQIGKLDNINFSKKTFIRSKSGAKAWMKLQVEKPEFQFHNRSLSSVAATTERQFAERSYDHIVQPLATLALQTSQQQGVFK